MQFSMDVDRGNASVNLTLNKLSRFKFQPRVNEICRELSGRSCTHTKGGKLSGSMHRFGENCSHYSGTSFVPKQIQLTLGAVICYCL